jgi:hypothetical protein
MTDVGEGQASGSAASPNVSPAIQMLRSAYDDYVAARLLLKSSCLWQGAMLASMAVEKYLKTLFHLRGVTQWGHLGNKLSEFKNKLASLNNLPTAIPAPFLTVLSRSYTLRYYNEIGSPVSCGFFRWQLLAELDRVVYEIEDGITLAEGDTEKPTPYMEAVDNDNESVFDQNWILNGDDREAAYLRPGFVLKYVEEENVILDLTVDGVKPKSLNFIAAEAELRTDRKTMDVHFDGGTVEAMTDDLVKTVNENFYFS